MTSNAPARTASSCARSVSSSSVIDRRHPSCETPGSAARIAIYGCGGDEAALFQEMGPRLGVTPTITDEALSDRTIGMTAGNHCVSVDHKTPIDVHVLLALRDAGVRYLSTRSVGYDHIDLDCAQRLGISVENVAYSPHSVADYTLMLMLMAVRDVTSTVNRSLERDYRPNERRGRELRDLTVGVVGTGRIGAAVIDRLSGFGCHILAHDRCPKIAVEYVRLADLLQRSDVVTLHTPLTPDTHHLLDNRRLAQMQTGAFVINTGRGALIDTAALLSSLEDGRLGGAALDVVEGEKGIFYLDHRMSARTSSLLSRLQQLPNVIITPHAAYFTEHALYDVVENTITNCLNFEESAR